MRIRNVTGMCLCVGACLVLAANADAQRKKDKPDLSPRASVTQVIGIDNDITFTYHRPGVKGRDVWTDKTGRGDALVPRNGDPIPWRAGANESTIFSVEEDVLVEGKALAAGEYGLFMIPTDEEWTVIFSKDAKGWGAYQYKQENDVLRVSVKPVEAPYKEWLVYGFEDLSPTGATAYLHWEKVKVPFRIEVKSE